MTGDRRKGRTTQQLGPRDGEHLLGGAIEIATDEVDHLPVFVANRLQQDHRFGEGIDPAAEHIVHRSGLLPQE